MDSGLEGRGPVFLGGTVLGKAPGERAMWGRSPVRWTEQCAGVTKASLVQLTQHPVSLFAKESAGKIVLALVVCSDAVAKAELRTWPLCLLPFSPSCIRSSPRSWGSSFFREV